MSVVRKFGGNCAEFAERSEEISEWLAALWKEGEPLAVIVSRTEAGSPAAKLAEQLIFQGVPAVLMMNCEWSNFPMDQTEEHLSMGKAVIVEIDQAETLAVALAAHLGWDCEVYTDLEGVYTVDPKLYPQAKKLQIVTYEEMMELSALGTSPLEARSVELAWRYDVRLYVGKVLETDHNRGTYIMDDSMYLKDLAVTGITVAENYTIFTVKEMEDDGIMISELFAILGELDINVDMISKQTQKDGKCSVSFSCVGAAAPNLEEALNRNESFEHAQVFRQESVAMISLVGAGMATRSGVAGKVFSVLRKAAIPCYQITTSEISISLAVDMENKDRAVGAFGIAFDL